jgi:hypothetical protein
VASLFLIYTTCNVCPPIGSFTEGVRSLVVWCGRPCESWVNALDRVRVHYIIIFLFHSWRTPQITAGPQSTQSDGSVRFLIFCSISISLLASLVAGIKPQCSAGPQYQGMYSSIPIHWNIKSAPASPGRKRAGPSLYYLASWSWTALSKSRTRNSGQL